MDFNGDDLNSVTYPNPIELDTIPSRDKIKIGASVSIVQKQDQGSGKLTEGIVKRILTSSSFHPHGIKVELESGKIGRVQKIS